MRVAVPLFGYHVAPRCEFANRFLIAEIEEGNIVCEEKYKTIAPGRPDRPIEDLLDELGCLGIKVILLEGYDVQFAPLAESKGIHVIDGVWGDAHQAIESFARGETLQNSSRDGWLGAFNIAR